MWEREQGKEINVGKLERWLSGLGGSALLVGALKRRSLGSLLWGAGGAALAYRGLSGHCGMYQRLGVNTAERQKSRRIDVHRAITVGRPVHDVYEYCRSFENMPRYMDHVQSVTSLGEGRTHWVMGEGRYRMEWDAEVTEDIEDRVIAWRSLPGGDLYSEGRMEFSEAPAGQGTEVRVAISFVPPGGGVGMVLAPVWRRLGRGRLGQDLHRLKQLMETGEIATGERHPERRAFEERERAIPSEVGQVRPAPETITGSPAGTPHTPEEVRR